MPPIPRYLIRNVCTVYLISVAFILFLMLSPGILALGSTDESGGELGKLLLDIYSKNSTVRENAAYALGELGDPKAVEPLIRVLREDESNDVREAAAISLGMIGDPQSISSVIDALGDEDRLVRRGAANGLGWMKDPKATEPLIWALTTDLDYEVRGMAAVSLGMIGDPQATDALIQGLSDESTAVRANCAAALSEIKDSKSVNPLMKALKDRESDVRWRAALALGEIGDPKAKDPLSQALNDEDASVREEAKAALEKLGVESVQAEDGGRNITGSVSNGSGSYSTVFSAQKIDSQNHAFNRNDPGATQIYYSLSTNGGNRWMFAGAGGRVEGNAYSRAGDPVFSKDGTHIAYKAWKGDKLVAVVDGAEGPEYEDIYNNIVLSPDGKRFAYRVKKGDQAIAVVVDGSEEGPYESVSEDPIISSNGQHVAYTISKKGTNYVVVDGVIQKEVGYGPVFSPDGSRWAYRRSASYAGDPCYIVLDGDLIDLDKDCRVGEMAFSPDGRRFAYDLIPGGGAYGDHMVVAEGVGGNKYPFPGVGKIVFSPDGSRIAYWAKAKTDGFVMVLDGEEGKNYGELKDPIFSPDGSHLAYVAVDGGRQFVVLDGQEGSRYAEIWGLIFSSDGRLAYAARDSMEGDVHLVVVDGKEDRAYAYGWVGQGILVPPIFSPDGSHVAYFANDGGKAEYVVVDGVQLTSPWPRLYQSPLVFDASDEFRYLGFNESGTYLVTARLGRGSRAGTSAVGKTGSQIDTGARANNGAESEDGSDQKHLNQGSLINTSEWGEVPSNQVLVVLKDGKGQEDAQRVAVSIGGKVVTHVQTINLYQIDIESSTEEGLKEAIDKARSDPDVTLAFPNQPGEASKAVAGIQCSFLDDSTYEGDRGRSYEILGVQNAWDLIRVSGLPLSDVHVGVVDDGLYKGQDEFGGKVKIDTSDPGAEIPAPNPGRQITGSHGTGVMNIIAADPGNGGIAGIASGALEEKLTVSMFNNFAPPRGDGTHCYPAGSMQAVEAAVAKNAKVVSCSWGASNIDEASAAAFKLFFEKMAADHPDILFVCSAGNDGQSVNGQRRWPSGLNLPNMITVGNIMNDGIKAQKSNTASNTYEVTLAAPGEEAVYGFNNKGDLYNKGGGTSMATPQVTSAAALLLSLNPDLTPGKIKEILKDTARKGVTVGTPGQAGWKTSLIDEGLGGRVLAIDEAVLKVINERRAKLNMMPLDMEKALASARVGLTVESNDAAYGEWTVSADIQGVGPQGADVIFDLQGEGAVLGSKRQHISKSSKLTWDVTLKDTATVVVKRLDTNGCSRAYLAEQVAGGSSNWLDKINPADYMLLAMDLQSPFSFGGDIQAEAQSWAYGSTGDKDAVQKNSSYLYAQQIIDLQGLPEGSAGRIWLQVLVFETQEIAEEYCKENFQNYSFNQDTYEGYSPGYNGLKDPRLEGGAGASSDSGKILQYRNAIARIEELGSVDRVYPHVPQLAKTWIDKVSKLGP